MLGRVGRRAERVVEENLDGNERLAEIDVGAVTSSGTASTDNRRYEVVLISRNSQIMSQTEAWQTKARGEPQDTIRERKEKAG